MAKKLYDIYANDKDVIATFDRKTTAIDVATTLVENEDFGNLTVWERTQIGAVGTAVVISE